MKEPRYVSDAEASKWTRNRSVSGGDIFDRLIETRAALLDAIDNTTVKKSGATESFYLLKELAAQIRKGTA